MLLTEYLKENTKNVHALTEKTMNAKAIFAQDYSKEDYLSHLTYLLKVHLIFEQIITTSKHKDYFKSNLPTLGVSELREDLCQINENKVEINIYSNPTHLFHDFPYYLGMMYVLKGSELGRNIIAKAISNHLVKWNLSQSYYYKEKDPTVVKNSWEQFCQLINSYTTDKDFYNKANNGALATFEMFLNPEKFAKIDRQQTA